MLEIIVVTSELEFQSEPTSDVPESETDTHNVKTFSAWCKRTVIGGIRATIVV